MEESPSPTKVRRRPRRARRFGVAGGNSKLVQVGRYTLEGDALGIRYTLLPRKRRRDRARCVAQRRREPLLVRPARAALPDARIPHLLEAGGAERRRQGLGRVGRRAQRGEDGRGGGGEEGRRAAAAGRLDLKLPSWRPQAARCRPQAAEAARQHQAAFLHRCKSADTARHEAAAASPRRRSRARCARATEWRARLSTCFAAPSTRRSELRSAGLSAQLRARKNIGDDRTEFDELRARVQRALLWRWLRAVRHSPPQSSAVCCSSPLASLPHILQAAQSAPSGAPTTIRRNSELAGRPTTSNRARDLAAASNAGNEMRLRRRIETRRADAAAC